MKKTRALSVSIIAAIIGVAVLVLAAGGNATKARSSGAATVGVRQTALGRILVGPTGRTLYLFRADRPNVSKLSKAGFAVWPAFVTTGSVKASGGASASKITAITSLGGRHQLSYAGHPLYYFVGDQRSGSTAGQGLFEFGAKWYVLSPSGTAVTSTPAPATTTPESTGGGYSY